MALSGDRAADMIKLKAADVEGKMSRLRTLITFDSLEAHIYELAD